MITKQIIRFIGMYAPYEKLRIIVYRRAGINIGNVSFFGSNIFIDINYNGLVTIKNGVIMAGFIRILSHSFILEGVTKEMGFSPVTIMKNVRIGIGVTILPGVTIGENSVIGAGALVSEDIPANCIAVGIPAKPIKFFKKN